jgi:molecular chaperone HtpG
MTKKTLTIHSENILPIIKKWLYSEKDIFLRELVSNSCDAITKLKLLQISDDFRVDISLDKEKKTLTISDNGIGMTADETEKYIAQIAFSGAEDFFNNYQKKEEIIGHFGLGFYSSYMVASLVTVDTLSYQKDAEPAFWSCDGSSEYELSKGTRKERGTTITLTLSDDEYLDDKKILSILQRFCSFMPYPIYFNEQKINSEEPLWLKTPKECTKEQYLSFYRTLYPFDQEPMFWIHLNIDVPFHVKGILYFPKLTKQFDFQKSHLKLYCNRVFVSDQCKDLLPEYLSILRGALDSPDIPLNVSRSYLQTDRTVKQLAKHIGKKISDKLHTMHREDEAKFLQMWDDIEPIIKLGLLQEESFYDRIKDILYFKNSRGQMVTLAAHTKGESNPTIYYTNSDSDDALIDLYHKKDKEILRLTSFMDSALISHLEGKEKMTFKRIDASIDSELLDSTKEKSLLDQDGKSEAGKMASFFKEALGNHFDVEAKSLDSDKTTGFFLMDESQRRMQDYMTLTQGKQTDLGLKKTFVINTNSPLVQKAYALKTSEPELSKKIVHQLKDFALVTQKQFDPSNLSQLCGRSQEIIEELSQLV